jgi:hypothetical protein
MGGGVHVVTVDPKPDRGCDDDRCRVRGDWADRQCRLRWPRAVELVERLAKQPEVTVPINVLPKPEEAALYLNDTCSPAFPVPELLACLVQAIIQHE